MDCVAAMSCCDCKSTSSVPSPEADLESLLNGLGVISPHAATIAAVDDNADDAIARLALAIANDPKLTARMLGLANSTALFPGRPIESVRQAVMSLGTELTKATCVAMIVSEGTRGAKSTFDRRCAWVHAMLVAVASRDIAKLSPLGILPGTAYSAGLLHDIGYLALSAKLPKEIDCLCRRVERDAGARSLELERLCLPAPHHALGAVIGRSIGLPSTITDAILYHHHPPSLKPARPLAACVALADQLSGLVEGATNPGFYPWIDDVDPAWLTVLKIERGALDPIIAHLQQDIESINSIASGIA
jgi:HD-like signal output (HDOD) protein